MGKSMKADSENPEWSAADVAAAGSVEAFPELAKAVKPGRPALPEAERKQRVTMYLDRDVVEHLRADGRGWQTRANAALREALGLVG